MSKQLVMDHTGHTEHVFNPKNTADLAAAEERFNELVSKGFVPAVLKEDGNHEVNRTFDPTAEQTLFVPQLKGG